MYRLIHSNVLNPPIREVEDLYTFDNGFGARVICTYDFDTNKFIQAKVKKLSLFELVAVNYELIYTTELKLILALERMSTQKQYLEPPLSSLLQEE